MFLMVRCYGPTVIIQKLLFCRWTTYNCSTDISDETELDIWLIFSSPLPLWQAISYILIIGHDHCGGSTLPRGNTCRGWWWHVAELVQAYYHTREGCSWAGPGQGVSLAQALTGHKAPELAHLIIRAGPNWAFYHFCGHLSNCFNKFN